MSIGRVLVLVGALSVAAAAVPATPVDASASGAGVTVAVIDTGFDTRHEFFTRPDGRSAFSLEVCIDACGPGVVTGPGVAASPVGDRAARRHGTHVAGVIAGGWRRAPSGRFAELRGVAPRASLIGIRVFGDDEQGVDAARIATALTWLAEHHRRLGLDVVNLSLGGGRHRSSCHRDHPELQQAVTQLWRAGVVVVAGSGNDGHRDSMSAPACLRHVISVAALDRHRELTPWSNHSRTTTVAAVGAGLWSSVPGTDAEGRRAAISVDDGTSLAAAVVTGVVALLRGRWPSATPDDIVAALRQGRQRASGIPVVEVTEVTSNLKALLEQRAVVDARGAVRPSVSRPEPRPAPPTVPVPVRRPGAA